MRLKWLYLLCGLLVLGAIACDEEQSTSSDLEVIGDQSGTPDSSDSADQFNGCKSDEDCEDQQAPACDTASGACVECTSIHHCAEGQVCEPDTFVCIESTGCTSDADCSGRLPACNSSLSLCVECTESNLSACGEEQVCEDSSCLTVESCDHTGFESLEEEVFIDSVNESSYVDIRNEQDDVLSVEVYYGFGASLEETEVELGVGIQANYETCAYCLLLESADKRYFFAREGTLTFTELSDSPGGSIRGNLSGVVLEEVTIEAGTFESTPVSNGEIWCIESLEFGGEDNACTSDESCAGETPHCNTQSGECVECLEDSHCGSDTPYCYLSFSECMECLDPFDCTAEAPSCSVNEARDARICAVLDACDEDDSHEPNDGPSQATALPALTLGTPSTSMGRICAGQEDWYSVVMPEQGDLKITLEFAGEADIDLMAFDAEGRQLGRSLYDDPLESLELHYLPSGEVYLFVLGYELSQSLDYELRVNATAASCSANGECSAAVGKELLRGQCELGVCQFINGNGALAEGELCDSSDDCTSGLCTAGDYFDFGNFGLDYLVTGADTRGYCVNGPCEDDDSCDEGTCSLIFCLPPCQDSSQCPIVDDPLSASGISIESIDGQERAVCDIESGKCG